MASSSTPPSSTASGWVNWAGDQSCTPAEIITPRSAGELAEAVGAAAAGGRTASIPGSGHSFTEAAMTDGTMIRIEALAGVIDVDPSSGLVKVGAGTVLADLNQALAQLGLAMENLGDIDRQTIAGAISTATHGTGAALRNISAQVEAIELVGGDGSVRELSAGGEPELLRAARVGVGALGAISAVTLRCVPAFTLHRIDQPRPLDEVVDSFFELAAANDHFEFFVFPYTDSALTIRRNRTEREPRPRGALRRFLSDVVLEEGLGSLMLRATRRWPRLIPRSTGLAARILSQGEHIDRSYRIFSNRREIRFTEMEYAIPRRNGPEAVRRVLELIREEQLAVAMPIECRVVAPDDALLSPSHERETTYVAVHQFPGMEWRPYFQAVEEIMDSYGGRPHWGKRHFQSAETLAPRYPRWADFAAARDELDPDRVFANEYATRVLGP
ncbi:MAG: D-arabinono-1,4-lactone oxidase [Solirubrobacterales bacterium]